MLHSNAITIHSYTNDQKIVDSYRGRAAAQSIIPNKTGSDKTIKKIFPDINMFCSAYRVPTNNVSIVDLYSQLDTNTDANTINQLLVEYSNKSTVATYNDEKLVSSDFNHNPSSCVFDINSTKVDGANVRIAGWYDNEWGFANRMIDMATHDMHL